MLHSQSLEVQETRQRFPISTCLSGTYSSQWSTSQTFCTLLPSCELAYFPSVGYPLAHIGPSPCALPYLCCSAILAQRQIRVPNIRGRAYGPQTSSPPLRGRQSSPALDQQRVSAVSLCQDAALSTSCKSACMSADVHELCVHVIHTVSRRTLDLWEGA